MRMRCLAVWVKIHRYVKRCTGSREHVPSLVSSSCGFQRDINLTLCIFFIYVLWKQQKQLKKTNQTNKKKKRGGGVETDRQNHLPGNLPMMKAKSLVSHSDLGATILDWGGRNSCSTCFFVTKTQRKAICGCVGVSEQCGARGAKQPALRVQCLHHKCFTSLALASVWSGPVGCAPWTSRAREMNSGGTCSGLVTFKRNRIYTLWTLWGVNWSTVRGDGSEHLNHKARDEPGVVINTLENNVTKLSQNHMETWSGRFLTGFMKNKRKG